MLTKDHLALGRFLLDQANRPALYAHAHAFLFGCVEPDHNHLSYLRGFMHYKKFHGHNAENTAAHIEKCIKHFQEDGLHSRWDYFVLGTMLHYIADGFTGPHNGFWDKDLMAHMAYERSLHDIFIPELKKHAQQKNTIFPDSCKACLGNARRRYLWEDRSMETDCRYIIETCEQMLLSCLRFAAPSINHSKEGIMHESTYHHGLVRAGH